MPASHVFAPDLLGDCTECPLPAANPVHRALPETPYAGSSGWSGSDTSRERAEAADADGTTSERQERVLADLRAVTFIGLTWKDLAAARGMHHGQASGVLSNLHKAGHIARLTERRANCQVYVMPEHVNGRETQEYGRRAADPAVVKRTEWRVTGSGVGNLPMDYGIDEHLARRGAATVPGGILQSRTVIETPWADAD